MGDSRSGPVAFRFHCGRSPLHFWHFSSEGGFVNGKAQKSVDFCKHLSISHLCLGNAESCTQCQGNDCQGNGKMKRGWRREEGGRWRVSWCRKPQESERRTAPEEPFSGDPAPPKSNKVIRDPCSVSVKMSFFQATLSRLNTKPPCFKRVSRVT